MKFPSKQLPKISKALQVKERAKDKKIPGKLMVDTVKKPLLSRKTAQEMEFTKHTKATENAKGKKLREYNDRSRRHARECARALRKGDQVPSPMSSFVSSTPLRQRYLICEQCHLPKAVTQFLPIGVNNEYQNHCLYCLTDSHGDSTEMRWFYHGSHEALRCAFVFNNQEHSRCNQCAKRDENIILPSITESLDN